MKPSFVGRLALLALCALVLPVAGLEAQTVTSGSITGAVQDPQKQPAPSATVLAGPTDVAVDSLGFVYVTGLLGNVIVQFDAAGAEVRRFIARTAKGRPV